MWFIFILWFHKTNRHVLKIWKGKLLKAIVKEKYKIISNSKIQSAALSFQCSGWSWKSFASLSWHLISHHVRRINPVERNVNQVLPILWFEMYCSKLFHSCFQSSSWVSDVFLYMMEAFIWSWWWWVCKARVLIYQLSKILFGCKTWERAAFHTNALSIPSPN